MLAKAGIQQVAEFAESNFWTPASAGVTNRFSATC